MACNSLTLVRWHRVALRPVLALEIPHPGKPAANPCAIAGVERMGAMGLPRKMAALRALRPDIEIIVSIDGPTVWPLAACAL